MRVIVNSSPLIFLAKRKGLIHTVRPYIEELRKHGFRISGDVIGKILESAGELKS
ncbi:MAG: DUF3368 domain-containing protein [Thermococcus sp.]|nr:DUF3368 domain-containing protein [Thermococcus sp.]